MAYGMEIPTSEGFVNIDGADAAFVIGTVNATRTSGQLTGTVSAPTGFNQMELGDRFIFRISRDSFLPPDFASYNSSTNTISWEVPSESADSYSLAWTFICFRRG